MPGRRHARTRRDTRAALIPTREPTPTSPMFSPGEPIAPAPGLSAPEGGPRQWAFPVGYNIGRLPRSGEATSFGELRNLAALYDGVQLCEHSLP